MRIPPCGRPAPVLPRRLGGGLRSALLFPKPRPPAPHPALPSWTHGAHLQVCSLDADSGLSWEFPGTCPKRAQHALGPGSGLSSLWPLATVLLFSASCGPQLGATPPVGFGTCQGWGEGAPVGVVVGLWSSHSTKAKESGAEAAGLWAVSTWALGDPGTPGEIQRILTAPPTPVPTERPGNGHTATLRSGLPPSQPPPCLPEWSLP